MATSSAVPSSGSFSSPVDGDPPVGVEQEVQQPSRAVEHHLVHAELVDHRRALDHADRRGAAAELVEERHPVELGPRVVVGRGQARPDLAAQTLESGPQLFEIRVALVFAGEGNQLADLAVFGGGSFARHDVR